MRASSTLIRGIVVGGLAVGILDALAATLIVAASGGRVMRVWQTVASGVLGRAAYDGGARTTLIGLAIHFFIAFTVVAVYHGASGVLPVLARRPVVWGPLYGVAVYFFMQLIVLRLALTNRRPLQLQPVLIGLAVHIFAVGLPAALSARRR